MVEMKVSNTEEGPVAPGWVDQELDEIFAGLPGVSAGHQARYAECLAGSRVGDVEASHDRCRVALLAALDADGVEAGVREGLGARLEALEAELTART
ncbi:MAG: hypothetical protein ACRYGC_12350 [Janthinobacterium lividum]